jgi:hypothetical protein
MDFFADFAAFAFDVVKAELAEAAEELFFCDLRGLSVFLGSTWSRD